MENNAPWGEQYAASTARPCTQKVSAASDFKVNGEQWESRYRQTFAMNVCRTALHIAHGNISLVAAAPSPPCQPRWRCYYLVHGVPQQASSTAGADAATAFGQCANCRHNASYETTDVEDGSPLC